MWRSLNRKERTFEWSLPVTGHVRLEVRSEAGDVTVREGPDGVVRVRGRVSVWGPLDQAWAVLDEIERRPPVKQTDGAIRIGDLEPWLNGGDCSVSADYRVETPPDTELRVVTESGDVEITGLRGPVLAELTSGDIGVSRIEGDLQVDVDSGDVAGEGLHGKATFDIASGDLALRDATGAVRPFVDSGDVTLSDLGSEFELDVGSGDVALASAVPDGARWTVQTDSGDIEVRLPHSSRCVIEAVADCGDIDCELPLEVETHDEGASGDPGRRRHGADRRLHRSWRHQPRVGGGVSPNQPVNGLDVTSGWCALLYFERRARHHGLEGFLTGGIS